MGRQKKDHLMYQKDCKSHKTFGITLRRDYGHDCVTMTLEDVLDKCGECIIRDFGGTRITDLTGDDSAGDCEQRVYNKLAEKGWKQLVDQSGATWANTKAALLRLGGNFTCYGMWWGKGSTSERFDNATITTHAFTITKAGGTITVDGNNMGDGFINDTEWASVYVPPNSPVARDGFALGARRTAKTVNTQGGNKKNKKKGT